MINTVPVSQEHPLRAWFCPTSFDNMLWEKLRKGEIVIGRWGNRREEIFKPVSSGSYYIRQQAGKHVWRAQCFSAHVKGQLCHALLSLLTWSNTWPMFQKQLNLLLSRDFFQMYAKANCYISTLSMLLIAVVLTVVRFPEGAGLSGKLCKVLPHS